MSRVYDNWERLVTATLRKEELRLIALRSPTPSELSSPSPVRSFNFAGFLEKKFRSFTYHQILRATDGFSASNLMKHGHSGDLFYGFANRTQVVIKKVDIDSARKASLFRSETEILGKVSHPRLVPLVGHCLGFGNRQYLVYKYMPNADLSTSLIRGFVTVDGRILPSIDWKTRLKVAIGAAEGLSYLHNECVPPFVHRDIQASSIFLDDNFEVRLGSLSRLCTISGPLQLPKDVEQETSELPFDVYCFGRVLLELVTGKLGFSAANHCTMIDLMAHSLAFIVEDNQKLVQDIMDPSLVIDRQLLMEIWGVALVAKACLRPKSSNRPQMANILAALKLIESTRLATYGVNKPTFSLFSVSRDLITTVLEGSKIIGRTLRATTNMTSSDHNTVSRNQISEARRNEVGYLNREILHGPNSIVLSISQLMDATRNFTIRTVEEKCEYERADKACTSSSDGTPISVMEYYSQNNLVLKEWQYQADILGRLSHPNLVKFHGHFLEGKELFLVHEFVQNGSLENYLFKTFQGSSAQLLTFKIRLKILIGAARGLAFLHANIGEGLYEYFEPSDILLDDSYHAKILGFGLAKVGRPGEFDDVHANYFSLGRCAHSAPEFAITLGPVKDSLSMESDVYGFGVVLCEVLTGLSAESYYNRTGCKFVKFLATLSDRERIVTVDSRLKGQCNVKTADPLFALAITCTDPDPKARPSMREVVKELERIESAMESKRIQQ